MSTLRILLGVLIAVSFFALPALSGPILPDQWYEFSFRGAGTPASGCFPADPLGSSCVPSSAGNSVFADTPWWTINITQPGYYLQVTDAFAGGDSFDVYDAMTLKMTTPAVGTGVFCGNDPEACYGLAGISYGALELSVGIHEFSIIPAVSPFDTGAAYFRFAAVPEPGTFLLMGAGLLGLGLVLRRRHNG